MGKRREEPHTLRELRILLWPPNVPLPADAPPQLQDAGRSKLGGVPDWIQGDQTPQCLHCTRDMTFVAQIDSFDSGKSMQANVDEDYVFGDAGMIYVFVCNVCGEMTVVNQCE